MLDGRRLLVLLCAASAVVAYGRAIEGAMARPQTRALERPERITISIVGTNDLHGRIFTDRFGRGGLRVLGGFVENLRAARAADGGGLLVLDAGDTFQGGIESNLSEGRVVVDAYDALGYTALAIGNHDFDFGPVDPSNPIDGALLAAQAGHASGPSGSQADTRGALKVAAARARFPFLAANIVDDATGAPIAWPNVRPSTIIETAGIRVGLIGLMTFGGLRQTLPSHVLGLRTSPLVPAIQREAAALRQGGAEIVVVVAHEGGWCGDTSNPRDLRSCDEQGEIFDIARRLPPGTVQAIVAGHTHGTMAHIVNEIGITSVPEGGLQFGRMDLDIDTATHRVVDLRVHPPRNICTQEDPRTHACTAPPQGVPVQYEGRTVTPSARVDAAMAPELARVHAMRALPLGAVADDPIGRDGEPETAIGNLFADALRQSVTGATAALGYGTGRGGLRTGLPGGPLTFGDAYDVFAFDNRVVRLAVTGGQLARALEDQLTRNQGRVASLSGIRATVTCDGAAARVALSYDDGRAVSPGDRLIVAASSYSAGRALWTAVEGEPGVESTELELLIRDAVTRWLWQRGHLKTADFLDPARPRWTLPAQGPVCGGVAPPR
jgi:5'-nucleotidase